MSRPVEIACDESGYEGEKLIGTTTDVFAHASVRLDIASAAACMAELRGRIRSPATEYKANHLLREKHRAVLEWLLGPAAPLRGSAHVYLIDKAFFVVGRVLDRLAEGGDADATTLYREGPRQFGRQQWNAFLVASNDLLRAKDGVHLAAAVAAFGRAVDALRRAGAAGGVDEILARLDAGSGGARLLDQPVDPLIPAIVRAVGHWSAGGRPVAIVHDRQNTLSPERIAWLREFTGGDRLASLRFGESHSEPRVQLADILAGTVRKIASDELDGRGDPQLTALLRPYLDPYSIWGDARSWSLLMPGAASTAR
jgi:hypothetical protein